MPHLFNNIGAFGRFQKLMLLNFSLVFAFLSMNLFFTVFTTAEPTLLCSSRSFGNQTFENETCKILSNFHLNESDYVCKFDTRYYGKTITTEWNLVCERKYLASLTQTFYLFGNLSSLFFGFLGDVYGRRCSSIVLFLFFPIVLISSELLQLQFLALSWYTRYIVYCCSLFLTGLLEDCIYGNLFVLLMELTTPKYHLLFALSLFYSYALGQCVVLLIAYFIRDWHIYNWITAGLSVFILIVQAIVMPESPRWQISKNLNVEAHDNLQRIASINKQTNKEWEIEDLFDIDETINDDDGNQFKQLVIPFRNAVKTMLLCYTCITIGLVFYGISLGVTSIEALDPHVAYLVSSISEIAGITGMYLINKKIGRKKANILFILSSSISCLFVGILPNFVNIHHHSETSIFTFYSIVMLTLVSISKCAASAAYGNIFIYASEVYSTSVRTSAILLLNGMLGVGSLLAPLVNLTGALLWKPMTYLIFSSASFLAAIFAFILPETYH